MVALDASALSSEYGPSTAFRGIHMHTHMHSSLHTDAAPPFVSLCDSGSLITCSLVCVTVITARARVFRVREAVLL